MSDEPDNDLAAAMRAKRAGRGAAQAAPGRGYTGPWTTTSLKLPKQTWKKTRQLSFDEEIAALLIVSALLDEMLEDEKLRHRILERARAMKTD